MEAYARRRSADVVMDQVRRLMRERRKLAEHDDDHFNLMDTKQIEPRRSRARSAP